MYAIWRFTSLLTSVLNRLLALALGVGLLHDFLLPKEGASSREFWIDGAGAWLSNNERIAIGCSALLVLLNLNVIQFLLFSLANRPGRAYIESKSPGGHSRVALHAIQNALAATALQVPEIARSRIRVLKLGKSRFRVHIRYWVRNVQDAGNAAEHLRLVMKKRFSDIVVLDPKDRVEFDLDLAGIEGLVLRPTTRKELPKPAPDRAGPPSSSFRGPVYPVDGEN